MKEPIRILHVLGALNRGGTETMVMNLYRSMDRNKIQFDFMIHTTVHCDYTDEILSLGGKIYSVPRYTGKNHFYYKKEWKAFLKEHPEYHILHGHVRSTAAIYLKIANQFGLITIAHSHSTSSGKGIAALVKNIMQLSIRYTADYLFACSLNAGEWLFGKEATKKENFYEIKNGINVEKYKFNTIMRKSVRKKFGFEDNQLVIGHVGRFCYPKNHEFLVDIFNEVHKERSDSILLLVGDGELRKKIEKKVEKLGLKKSVIFTGVRNDVPDLMQAMDVFVFPSYYEGLGIALIEAQASGLPCFTSENTVPKETALIIDLVHFVQLEKPAKDWCAEIFFDLEKKPVRLNRTFEICNKGYDIFQNTKRLELLYNEIGKGKLE